MAENNYSAPLKTAEGAALALPYPDLWRDSVGIRGYTADPGQGPWFTADQMLAYAAKAAAAQAPAELPVKSAITIGDLIFRAQTLLSPDTNDSSEVLGFVEDVRGFLYLLAQNSGGLSKEEIEVSTEAWLTPETKEEAKAFLNAAFLSASSPGTQPAPAAVAVPEQVKALRDAEARLTLLIERDQHKLLDVVARDACRAALAATTELPATEYSSAGDLAHDTLRCAVGNCTFNGEVAQHAAGCQQSTQPTQAEVQAEPVANCYSDDGGDTWRDCPDDSDFVEGRQLGEEFELQASIRSWSETFRVTKVPDETSDDYEVEPVAVRTAPQAQPADALDAETVKKAARYDWLRAQGMLSDGSGHPNFWRCMALLGGTFSGGESADDTIDAAMAAAQEGGKA